MINIYKISFGDSNKKSISYTSMDALYTAHGKEEIGVVKGTLYNHFLNNNVYENKKLKVRIEKSKAYNANDVKQNLHK